MKKNITINLCGRLFAIDEDAYEMLATYEQSLRNYFRTREGGEEIAEDLEARIAELFDELKAQNVEAINIDHVREVIHRIGRPEEMEGEAPGEQSTQQPTPDSSQGRGDRTGGGQAAKNSPPQGGAGQSASKRLYRNPDDKKLMGVLSGFAAYFGGDVLWWRLGYAAIVLLTFAGSSYNFLWFLPHQYLYFNIYFWGFALILAYILLAVLMPVAETPEDRLRMKGMEVNPQNLAEEVANSRPTPCPPYEGGSGYQISEEGASSQMHSTPLPNREGQGGGSRPSGCLGCIGGFFVALWTVISTLFRWCIYAFGAFVAVMCLFGIVCLTAFAVNPFEFLKEGDSFFRTEEFAALVPSLTVPFYIFVVAAGIVLAITAYALIHSLLNEFKQMPSMPYRQRIALLVMWIAGLAVAGAAIGYGFPKLIKASEEYSRQEWQKHDARERAENTHEGIYVQPHEWNFLQDNGWKILNAEGCNDRFTSYGEHLSGDRDVRYLDCYDDNHRQRYRVERADTLQPGTYRLTCAARANGTGVCIYAIVGNQKPQLVEIPATGNTGGDIWVEADKFVRFHNDVPIPSDSVAYGNQQCELVEVNDHKGYGWNRIAFEPFRITAPTVVRYGLTSDNAFTGRTWLGQWFSATDFHITRVE
ncbi:MAG: PspC domain-containing protein [Bacteroidaceae bacterium]|nr:PspC domain-containing protein [Bacteroidaceae bacterium]